MFRIVILIFVSLTTFANEKEQVKKIAETKKEILVEYGQFRYRLKYSETEISLKGEGIELGFKAQPCNLDFIKETYLRIETQMKFPFLPVLPQKGLRITQGGKVHFEESESKRGVFFIGLPSLFKQLVIEEQLLCKK